MFISAAEAKWGFDGIFEGSPVGFLHDYLVAKRAAEDEVCCFSSCIYLVQSILPVLCVFPVSTVKALRTGQDSVLLRQVDSRQETQEEQNWQDTTARCACVACHLPGHLSVLLCLSEAFYFFLENRKHPSLLLASGAP